MATEIAIPLLITLSLFAVAFVVMTRHVRHMQRQRQLPSREAFLAAHEGRAACPVCAGESFRERGLDGQNDACRVVSCDRCGQLLYRDERPAAGD